MRKLIRPTSYLSGSLKIPGDKSISHRAIIFASLAIGKSEINNCLFSEDVLATIDCLKALGVKIERRKDKIIVEGIHQNNLKASGEALDCKNSGTTMRLLMGLFSSCPHLNVKLVGDDSLSKRPMKRVSTYLEKMGAEIKLTQDEFAPVEIIGKKLNGKVHNLKIPSAQIKSSLILAALNAEGETVITGKLKSRDHTERMLPAFGCQLIISETEIKIPGKQILKGTSFNVPGDFSTASFWMTAGVLMKYGHISLNDVSLNPSRLGLLKVLKRMGANIHFKETNKDVEPMGNIQIYPSSLTSFRVTEDEVPDLIDEIPLLAILATQAHGESEVRGASELKVKESNRLNAITQSLKKMGVELEVFDDGFKIKGPQILKGAVINSFHDHRIAMSFSIAGLIAQGETYIENAECVSISYPDFYEHLDYLIAKKALVIGNPISQSLSPAIYSYFAFLNKENVLYQAQEVAPERLSDFIENSRHLIGFNVTIPFKKEIISHLQLLDESAKSIGAVNFVKVNANSLVGFNTDVEGIQYALRDLDFSKFQNCLVIGAGGASRATLSFLKEKGIKNILIHNRSNTNRDELIKQYPEIKVWSKEILDPMDLIINTTSVGMNGQGDPLFFNFLKDVKTSKNTVFFDMIYNPEKTFFLSHGEGHPCKSGLDMLMGQAKASWDIFMPNKSEVTPELELLLKSILKIKKNSRSVAITGFMGVGKTTIGRLLSNVLGFYWYDLDEEISHKCNMSVGEFIKINGEKKFRELEELTMVELKDKKDCIISLGGGSLLSQKNLEIIKKNMGLVYLNANEKTLLDRLDKSLVVRPLFNKTNLKSLIEEREKNYRSADVMIDTDHLIPFEVVMKIIIKLGEKYEEN